ncbi:hypothetical protein NLJ89_g1372 [Agrocybe chaxingu]|uniref:FMN hydroxy acid dehydrogenase domain-containing protein n=1 Tax=Agrocybe chaxingu TaxID=84603 RepID=A0A9W8N041_9AGAR|nr:hypothetical protein NLJ89_g1372 [Agrocybe chaxingu]
MRPSFIFLGFVSVALAARPFLNEPDTAIEDDFGDLPAGALPDLSRIVGLPDFNWVARRYMNISAYTFYRTGSAGEWSYRNNLEVFNRFRFRPRVMTDITNIESTLPTTILGYNFSAPFYISPCSRGGLAHPEAERGLVQGAAAENILYVPSLFATLSIEDIAAAKNASQVIFQQVYLDSNDTATQLLFDRIERSGAKAIVFTVDAPADGNRHRAARFGANSKQVKSILLNTVPAVLTLLHSLHDELEYSLITWDIYKQLQTMTTLPIIIKGIGSVEDARAAVAAGAPGIILSNHGGRQLDGSPSSLEIALEIHEEAPEVFTQTEVFADGGVRYGTDVLKLLALGVRAVGIGRPFMFSNVYGKDGVVRAIQLLKREIAGDAANLGLGDLKKIDASYVKWTPNHWYG